MYWLATFEVVGVVTVDGVATVVAVDDMVGSRVCSLTSYIPIDFLG